MGERWRSRLRAAGPLAGVALWAWMQAGGPGGDAAVTAGLAVWMALWWLTGVVPLYVTALLPLLLLPLAGVQPLRAVAAAYAHPLIFLFLGGFLIADGLARAGLDRRAGTAVLRRVGQSASALVGWMMAVTAMLSMWISNTAAALVMLPVALSVLDDDTPAPLASCLLLGVAYASSIGGMATLVGTPPNLFLAAFLEQTTGRAPGFVEWLSGALPLSALLLAASWLLLVTVVFHVPTSLPRPAAAPRLPWSAAERRTGIVFLIVAAAWITRPWLQRLELGGHEPLAALSDTAIALGGAVALFLIPSGDGEKRLLDAEAVARLPWGVLLLFGGGLALAGAIDSSGLARYLGSEARVLAGVPPWIILLAVVSGVVMLTELTSNTATTATLVPVLAALAPQLEMDVLTLTAPAALAASCAFMLPVATPPNAIVFATGRVRVAEMVRAGTWLNLCAIALLTLAFWLRSLVVADG